MKFQDSTRVQIFGRVRAVVNAAAEDGKKVGDLPTTLKILTIKGAKLVSTHSNPMRREVFEKLLTGADERMTALLYVAMNCAMYAQQPVRDR